MARESLPKKLLVEGEHDRLFAEACCERIGLKHEIQIGPPSQLTGNIARTGNGKGNAIKLLPDLIEQLNDGSVTRLGLVLDADFLETDGLGFGKTWRQVTDLLIQYGYQIPPPPQTTGCGFCFPHVDGLADFGLWIMPNNFADGMLEDFVKASVTEAEQPLLQHACATVAALPDPKFKPNRKSKAEVASWMAWQASPGQGINGAVGAGLLNFDHGMARQYIEWLSKVFT